MDRFTHMSIFVLAGILLFCSGNAQAIDLESRYAGITYSGIDDLRTFNDKLYMGLLKPGISQSRGDTIENEVAAKIDFIVEKVMYTLDMHLLDIRFSIIIRPDVKTVKLDFRRLYNTDVDYIAFYSPSRNIVFFSADSSTLRVVAHEIGHVVAESYFTISPPQRIHEVMAQFAEQHITD